MSVDSTTPDEHTAVVRVTTGLAPEQAFDAFADSTRLGRWFWPARFATRYEGSLTPGGTLHAVSDEIGMGFTASVTSCEPGAALECDWRWDGDDDVTTVRVEIVASGHGSTVTVTHGANATPHARDEHEAGWRSCLERLESYTP